MKILTTFKFIAVAWLYIYTEYNDYSAVSEDMFWLAVGFLTGTIIVKLIGFCYCHKALADAGIFSSVSVAIKLNVYLIINFYLFMENELYILATLSFIAQASYAALNIYYNNKKDGE